MDPVQPRSFRATLANPSSPASHSQRSTTSWLPCCTKFCFPQDWWREVHLSLIIPFQNVIRIISLIIIISTSFLCWETEDPSQVSGATWLASYFSSTGCTARMARIVVRCRLFTQVGDKTHTLNTCITKWDTKVACTCMEELGSPIAFHRDTNSWSRQHSLLRCTVLGAAQVIWNDSKFKKLSINTATLLYCRIL